MPHNRTCLLALTRRPEPVVHLHDERCSGCGVHISEDSGEQLHEVTLSFAVRPGKLRHATWKLCRDCRQSCPECGDWIDDETANRVDRGPVVWVRQAEDDGRYMEAHAECMADHLLQAWSGDNLFYSVAEDRETISDIVSRAFAADRSAA